MRAIKIVSQVSPVLHKICTIRGRDGVGIAVYLPNIFSLQSKYLTKSQDTSDESCQDLLFIPLLSLLSLKHLSSHSDVPRQSKLEPGADGLVSQLVGCQN